MAKIVAIVNQKGGVGKTTISRIFAKALNCQGADGKGGVTAHPCGVCEACRAIDEGVLSTTSNGCGLEPLGLRI